MKTANHKTVAALNTYSEDSYFYMSQCGILTWSHCELEPTEQQLDIVSKFDNIDSLLQVLVSELKESKGEWNKVWNESKQTIRRAKSLNSASYSMLAKKNLKEKQNTLNVVHTCLESLVGEK